MCIVGMFLLHNWDSLLIAPNCSIPVVLQLASVSCISFLFEGIGEGAIFFSSLKYFRILGGPVLLLAILCNFPGQTNKQIKKHKKNKETKIRF